LNFEFEIFFVDLIISYGEKPSFGLGIFQGLTPKAVLNQSATEKGKC